MGGRVKELRSKKVSQNHRNCQLCLRSECKWCHMCVCSPFQVIRHILKFVNWHNRLFTVNIHVSTKTCVTGNSLVLHKALVVN